MRNRSLEELMKRGHFKENGVEDLFLCAACRAESQMEHVKKVFVLHPSQFSLLVIRP